MRTGIFIAIGAAAIGLAACSDSEATQKALEKEALAALDETTHDPMAMQVRRVTLKDDQTICGEVNRKDQAGVYQGFDVFLLDRRSGKALVAEPVATETRNGLKPIEVCADADQKQRFEERKAEAEADFSRELDAFARETRIRELEAKILQESAQP